MRQKQEEGKIHLVCHFRLSNITFKVPSRLFFCPQGSWGFERAYSFFFFEKKPSADIPSLPCITADRKKLAEKKWTSPNLPYPRSSMIILAPTPPPPMCSKVRSREERQLDIYVDRRRGGKDILKFISGRWRSLTGITDGDSWAVVELGGELFMSIMEIAAFPNSCMLASRTPVCCKCWMWSMYVLG